MLELKGISVCGGIAIGKILYLDGFGREHRGDGEPFVLVADDVLPEQMMKLDSKLLQAVVLCKGTVSSHASILARCLNIPALIKVSADKNEIKDGLQVIVDGDSGTMIISPEAEALSEAQAKAEEWQRRVAALKELIGKENVTRSGKRIEICVNISGPDDIDETLLQDTDGVGIFRTEFLYLGRPDLPDEEEQTAIYAMTAEKLKGKKVIIRTIDLGADKQAEALPPEQEDNPALGCRGIRISFAHPELFRTQLRALLRASVAGDIRIMYPMITSCEEVVRIREFVQAAAAELEKEGLPYRIPPQGVMIETPAAVMISDRLAEMVDFFSVGTNDLTQYTLALDRQNSKLDAYYQPHHEAILRMLQLATENAHKAGIEIGICGELGADTQLTERFIQMGIDELSVAYSALLKVRKTVRELS